MVGLVSRTGRDLQRYNKGRRQVVGCIPYRYRVPTQTCLDDEDKFEVLVISSQRRDKGMLFPKGGWETDESMEEAASRETLEEAGVRGSLEQLLGRWYFKNKSQDTCYEGFMFPLLVKEQLDFWPERHFRQRRWMSVAEAKDACQHPWMRKALDELVIRLKSGRQIINEEAEVVGPCSLKASTRKSNL